jgi:5-methylthioadenosine/S-adenosylhomocysteine deaminase
VTGTSLAVAGATLDGKTIDVQTVDGLITEIGSDLDLSGADEVIDGTDLILAPSLVNGHTHAAMTILRGRGGDLPLDRWLQEVIWPIEKGLSGEDIYWGARLACIEMARNGVSSFWDMYWQSSEVARAVRDSGLRAVVGPVILSLPDQPDTGAEDAALIEDLDRIAEMGPMVRAAIAPHAIYTVDTERLSSLATLAEERDLPIHIHLSETEKEVLECVAAHGLRPASYLDRLGLLGPRTLLAHGVWLDDEELELIAERGATIVTNPVANQKLAVGRTFPLPRALEAGVSVGLGTDGPASNDSLDPLSDLKVLGLAQRNAANDAAVLKSEDLWHIATGQSSDLLGAGSVLEPGSPADFMLLDARVPELATGDLTSNLVYAASGSAVDSLIVNGRAISLHREVAGLDEVVDKVAEIDARLGGET